MNSGKKNFRKRLTHFSGRHSFTLDLKKKLENPKTRAGMKKSDRVQEVTP